MISRYGLEATQQYYETMRQSVALVRDNLERYGIDAWATVDGEVTLAHLPSRVQELRDEQAFLKQTFGDDTEFLSKDDLKAQGLDGPGFFAGLKGNVGFGVHPLNYVRGLARAAAQAGAKIHGRSRLIRWEETARWPPPAHGGRAAEGEAGDRRHQWLYAGGCLDAPCRPHHARAVQRHRHAAADGGRAPGAGLDLGPAGL